MVGFLFRLGVVLSRLRPIPSPGKVEEEMRRIRMLAIRILELAAKVSDAYEETHEAAHWSGGGGGSITPGGRGGAGSDPTGQAAMPGPLGALRGQVRQAARQMRQIEPLLERTESTLREAFATVYDPDMRAKFERIKQLEKDLEEREKGA